MSDPFASVRDLRPDTLCVSVPQPRRLDAVDMRIERLLFAIEVHGPSVAYEEPNRSFVRSLFHSYPSAFWQIKNAVEYSRHTADCTCWDCVERVCFELLRPWLLEAGARNFDKTGGDD